ncbi:DUF6503 family protein [Rasiella sp. SM2506]|uniref:DUF6503 family protein n=1 Tax=Rasiella sp. SM2506 TaxID=3423914 RepID=UPI003D7BD4AB
MKTISILAILVLFLSCEEKPSLTANTIIDKAIEASCQGNCDHAELNFVFRKVKYKSIREGEKYIFERNFIDSTGNVRDVLSNDGFKRYRNDSLQIVADTTAHKYAESVNSVHYFAQLPYGLNAPAAKKELLGEATIKDKNYYEIGVTFSEEGGGTDFEDKFVYWVDKETFQLDYLAYSYAVNGGGVRFREAYNPRVVEGIRFVDYNNYKPASLEIPLTDLDSLFQKNELELLSKIETENVEVTLLKDN